MTTVSLEANQRLVSAAVLAPSLHNSQLRRQLHDVVPHFDVLGSEGR